MGLKEQINEDVKAAMRSGDTARRDAIRLLLAAMKQKEVDERVTLDDAAIVAIIDKLLKQRRDSITQYTAAGRHDLAEAEKFEASVLSDYMPQALSPSAIGEAIEKAIVELNAKAPSDMGQVMARLKVELAGRADMTDVSKRVKTRLSQA